MRDPSPQQQEEQSMGDLFGGWFNKLTNAIDITGNVEPMEDESPRHEDDFVTPAEEPEPV